VSFHSEEWSTISVIGAPPDASAGRSSPSTSRRTTVAARAGGGDVGSTRARTASLAPIGHMARGYTSPRHHEGTGELSWGLVRKKGDVRRPILSRLHRDPHQNLTDTESHDRESATSSRKPAGRGGAGNRGNVVPSNGAMRDRKIRGRRKTRPRLVLERGGDATTDYPKSRDHHSPPDVRTSVKAALSAKSIPTQSDRAAEVPQPDLAQREGPIRP